MKVMAIASKSIHSSSENRIKLQNILNRITTKQNELDSMTWYVEGAKFNFEILVKLQQRYPSWWENKPIDLIWVAKIIFLESIDGRQNKSALKTCFDALMKTFFYLAEKETYSIKKEFLDQYIGFLMMHSIESTTLVSRLSPLVFLTVQNSLAYFREWSRILSSYELKGIVLDGFFSEKAIESAAKNAINIESGGDLTYRDWKDGGSFNHLTLDYGRYYVEHCTEFFDQNIGLALALQKTLKKLPDIVKSAGFSTSEANMINIKAFVNQFLINPDISESPIEKFLNSKRYKKIGLAVLQDFSYNLRQIRAIEALHTDEEIVALAKKIGFKEDDADKREWIRHLIDIREPLLIPDLVSTFNPKGNSEYSCFKAIIGNSIDLDTLNGAIDKAYERLLQSVSGEPPSVSYYKSIGCVSSISQSKDSYDGLFRFLDRVENSGIVQFIALTGWRESEYGFSLSDIKLSPNKDKLDEYACPVCYKVFWKVPKTNKDTKLDREITRCAYRRAYQLSQIVNAKDTNPCLYSFDAGKNKAPEKSAGSIRYSIPAMWVHFVDNYKPFVKLDLLEELEVLKSKISRNNFDEIRLSELMERANLEQWENLKSDYYLVEAHRRAHDESDRVAFYQNPNKPKNWIWQYRNGNLLAETQTMLDTYLSEETKAIIESLQTEEDITNALSRAISNEFIGDCLYPTPHAFRHMWAEAVYRRFDGDAGWMIRSQFKHISQSMWLAYIRNKDNRRQHDQVKRKVISSLLANYLRKSGEGYAGAMDKLLRRLFHATELSTTEELNKAIDQYGMLEIVDIKANPWGYCLLRRRNQESAKCAEGGVPQRHNASPAFCLGCTNNLTQGTNIPGILLGISNDLKVLNTNQVPESFRQISYNTVTNAFKQLKKLGCDSDTLDEIAAALKAGARKRKLSLNNKEVY